MTLYFHRAFDVELLYIAQTLKIYIAEVGINWQEIDGKIICLFILAYANRLFRRQESQVYVGKERKGKSGKGKEKVGKKRKGKSVKGKEKVGKEMEENKKKGRKKNRY